MTSKSMTKRPKPVHGRLRHAVPGRVRIALDQPLPPQPALEAFSQRLSAIPDVRSVKIRTGTGSLIVEHDGAFEPIVEAAAKGALLTLADPEPPGAFDPIGETFQGIGATDALLGRLTNGRIDLMSLAFTALVAGGLVQLARGRVAGPALALFGQAATLAMTGALGLSKPQR